MHKKTTREVEQKYCWSQNAAAAGLLQTESSPSDQFTIPSLSFSSNK